MHSHLLSVLERALGSFKSDRRYANDPRYLKLWLLYARNLQQKQKQNPVDVFKFLAVNDIAQDLALFYEEYASLMISLGR